MTPSSSSLFLSSIFLKLAPAQGPGTQGGPQDSSGRSLHSPFTLASGKPLREDQASVVPTPPNKGKLGDLHAQSLY